MTKFVTNDILKSFLEKLKAWLEEKFATKDELKEIESQQGVSVKVVEELPVEAVLNVIYFVPGDNPKENNKYDEYMYIDEAWELIGTTDIPEAMTLEEFEEMWEEIMNDENDDDDDGDNDDGGDTGDDGDGNDDGGNTGNQRP